MTSWVFSLLFLASQFSSSLTVDPAGLKVRITDRALDTLTALAKAIIQENLLNKKFQALDFLACKINVSFPQMAINQADLSFRENSSFKLSIRNSAVSITFDSEINCFFNVIRNSPTIEAVGLSADIEVGLSRNEHGHLVADIRNCEATAEGLRPGAPGIARNLLERIQGILALIIRFGFCPGVRRYGLPFVNQMLSSTQMEVFEHILIDYSLTRDIKVTTTSLEMSVKGLVYRQGGSTDVVKFGADPVFRENSRMVYVGISDYLFNTAAEAFYEADAMKTQIDLRAGIQVEVGLTKAPSISITDQGLTVSVRAKARVIKTAIEKNPKLPTISAECVGTVQVSMTETHLFLLNNEVNCEIITRSKVTTFLANPLKTFLNKRVRKYLAEWKELKLPFPERVTLTQQMIWYYEGFMVVGGDLGFEHPGDGGLNQQLNI